MKVKEFIGKTTFITGSSKGVGKTALLNYLLNCARLHTKAVTISIGIDGERKDTVYGKAKPAVFFHSGDYVVTTDLSLKSSDTEFEVLEVFPYNTVLGKLVLVKLRRGGFVEITGPENNIQLADILKTVKTKFKLKTIFVDGAVNRVTQVCSADDSQFVYVLRVDKVNLKSSIDNIKLVWSISKARTASKNENGFCFDGAVTSQKILKIPKNVKSVVIEDFSKVFLSYNEWVKLCDKYKVKVKNKLKLLGFSVNLYDLEKSDFEYALKDSQILNKIMFNPYLADGQLK